MSGESGERSVLELCAGGGGQACGFERAGLRHEAAVEIEDVCTETLRLNRPHWRVLTRDIRDVDGADYRDVNVVVVAGGVPCSPFSIAGRQHGADDERDLFPEALRIVGEARPTAVVFENVPALAGPRFDRYRMEVLRELERLGYVPVWKVLNAYAFGVPQLRPRFVLAALRQPYAAQWRWPAVSYRRPPTVGETLEDRMAARRWPGARSWALRASGVAPTIVGGSHKHGGPDLGPTRARQAWRRLGVNGSGVADEAPGPEAPVDHLPKLTVQMVASIQGFPDEWRFAGGKTAAYRQVGNAFPPPVAAAVGGSIRAALAAGRRPARRGPEQRRIRAHRSPQALTIQDTLF